MREQQPFKWRHFQADIILLSVRWYLRCRAPSTQGSEQSSGTFASTDTATRTYHATLQIPWTGPTVSLRFWADFGSLSAQTASPHCRGLPCSHAGSLPGLERGGQRKDSRLIVNHPFQSSASLLPFSLLFKKALLFSHQVDNTVRNIESPEAGELTRPIL